MARQTSLITFTGRLGNVIGYCRDGEHFLRSMPETVRQTTGTLRAARRFGAASRKGALIRSAFTNELDIHCDGGHVNRLNKAFIRSGNNIMAALKGFRFNQQTGTERFFSIAPELSGTDLLHIPAQVLPEIKGVTALEVKVIATRVNFGTQQVVDVETAITVLDLSEPFAGATLPVNVPGRGILVVTLQVRAINGENPSCNSKYMAADVIAVLLPQAQPVLPKSDLQQQVIYQQSFNAMFAPLYAHISLPAVQRE
ncbi:hypothetical protein [Chitinophaga sp. S165]|uniref:hypothetical protein n=1 Tax=Chitinophaga sp. S165 TaxID=2135462 RepID=UPI000D70D2A9|nr:hypothetical protein [Chitinophaga sp. S165]PWV46554.1 hypothetical protein C7475_110114 [Chitinophaga sp. S165]